MTQLQDTFNSTCDSVIIPVNNIKYVREFIKEVIHSNAFRYSVTTTIEEPYISGVSLNHFSGGFDETSVLRSRFSSCIHVAL